MPRQKKPTTTPGIISNQVLARADGGSIDDLWDIYNLIDSRNCSPEVIRILLKHLKVELVPNIKTGQHREPTYETYRDRVLPSIASLGSIVSMARQNPSVREMAANALRGGVVDGICLWVNFCLHFGLPLPSESNDALEADLRRLYFIHARFLSNILELDARVRSLFLSSSTFSDLFLRIWMSEGKDGLVLLDLNASFCPIVTLFIKVAASPEGCAMLLDRIFIRPADFALHFAGGVAVRLEILQDKAECEVAAHYITVMLLAIQQLTWSSPHLRRTFHKIRYLAHFSAALDVFSHNNATSPRLLAKLVDPTELLFKLAWEDHGRGLHNVRDLFDASILQHMVRLLSNLPLSDIPTIKEMNRLFRSLMRYSIYPCVLTLASQAKVPPNTTQVLKSRHPGLEAAWYEIGGALGDRTKVQKAMTVDIDLCDNLHCPRSADSGKNSKACSRCASVVYCSESCQKRDWRERHKSECPHALANRLARIEDETWYSHRSRSFQVAYMAHAYTTQLADMPDYPSANHPNTPIHQLLPVMNCMVTKIVVAFDTLLPPSNGSKTKDRTMWWGRHDDRMFSQKYLKPRVFEMVDDYLKRRCLNGENPDDMRLVEGLFQAGRFLTMHLLVKLRKVNGKYKPMSSIALYGSCDNTWMDQKNM